MKLLYLVLFLCSALDTGYGLYEDQVGSFEWRQQYIGKTVFSHMDIASPIKKIIVGTNQNVVAALSLKSGNILWRNVLEQGENGKIAHLHVDQDVITTISGARTPVVRGWDLESGHALFEWAMGPALTQTHSKIAIVGDYLVHFSFPESKLLVTWYDLQTGKENTKKSGDLIVANPSLCIVLSNLLVCIDGKTVYRAKAGTPGSIGVMEKANLKDTVTQPPIPIPGPLPVAEVNIQGQKFLFNWDEMLQIQRPVSGNDIFSEHLKMSTAKTDGKPLLLFTDMNTDVLTIRTFNADNNPSKEYESLRSTVPYEGNKALPDIVTSVCQQRRDDSIACRVLISATDDSLTLVQHPGEVLWTREEALASIVSVEIVELPVSDTDAAIEKEFGDNTHGIFGMIGRRLMSQWLQLQTLLLTVLGVVSDSSRSSSGLVRDDFGLHKLIVAVTLPGKIFGIDNLSGEIVWQIVADIDPLGVAGSPSFPLFPMRSAVHADQPAQLAVLGRTSVGDGLLLVFNPITGTLTEPLVKLGYKVRQATPIHSTTDTFLRGILLLDNQQRVHVYPEAAKSVAKAAASNTYLYTVEPNSGQIDGYALRVTDGELVAVRTWQQKLGQDEARVVAVVPKRDGERVHSQGRVLGDRNVLYKYVNPNLVAVFTQAYHPVHKTILNLFLLDAVSGVIVFSASHRRARDPVQAVHAENWLVYSFASDKHRRTEVATLELYEGPFQSNATAFSSLSAPPVMPTVERQAYILPAHVTALRDTVTDMGITTKHILVALSSGGVLELPWAYLDPRRTMMVTQEMREEGIVPYMPELPIPFEAIINHNQSVVAVRGIHSAPSGIESTSLIFVYGLDILYTRVAPSKTFDLLKEDFDYVLISAVLAGLIVASFVTKRMASRKALKQAWK